LSVGGFDPKTPPVGEDYEYFMRCALSTPIGMPEPSLAKYRIEENSISHNMRKYWRTAPRNFLGHLHFFKTPLYWDGFLPKSYMKQIAFEAANENAYFWRNRRHFGKAAWFAWQQLRLTPFAPDGWKHLISALLRRK
jgi:hypothetical protein